ncbi:MAG TPA: CoA-binding protein [Bacteroidia bacterium]|nr:CoA-binding protein [Bacteroidia bacterium]QQR95293.1 MAG: CoA-binding protein [Bacteroidota bacterium]MBP7715599.1 CoA-binding protein [Bacteroidia bacterium]MBP8669130.1 CoA-binding protein [Bacteroidia bacterium]HOZ82820.1 CoA-binding protein [Bacteroidia bacterium]
MTQKKTLVLGASTNPARYSNKAILKLRYYKHPVVAIGGKPEKVEDITIETGNVKFKDIDTVTMYLNAERQKSLEDYILSLKPKRIIFNPGAENESLKTKAEKQGIECVEACTLVMLTIGAY